MLQEKIQAWIERIIIYIQDVIRLESRNKYKEGRLKGKGRESILIIVYSISRVYYSLIIILAIPSIYS